jgi:hypothetical protein
MDGVMIMDGMLGLNRILFMSTRYASPQLHVLKTYATTIVNPPWSLKELEMVRQYAYGYIISADGLRDEYAKWGGNPQFVLEYAGYKKDRDMQLNDIDSSDVFDPSSREIKVLTRPYFHFVPAQRVPDYATNDSFVDFKFPDHRWCSRAMADLVWNLTKRNNTAAYILKFISNDSRPLLLRGLAFEPHVLNTLQDVGIYGRTKLLTNNGENQEMRPQRLGPLERVTFSDYNELASPHLNHVNKFYVPSDPNATIDIYVPTHGLLIQSTIWHRRGVKWAEIDQAIKAGIFNEWLNEKTPLADTSKSPKLRLVFVCPKIRFIDFRRQRWLQENGAPYNNGGGWEAADEVVEQYCWELDVEHQFEIMRNRRGGNVVRQRNDMLRECGNWGVNDIEPRLPLAAIVPNHPN